MKQSVIKYKKLADGQIKIVGFENIAGKPKLEKEIGLEIKQIYTSMEPWYLKINNSTISINGSEICVDQIIPKETFQQMICTMKAAGNRLMEIKSSIDKRVHEVRI